VAFGRTFWSSERNFASFIPLIFMGRAGAHSDEAMKKAQRRIVYPILGMNEITGGIQRCGGPLWTDGTNLLPR
jgi:hypothetical protein